MKKKKSSARKSAAPLSWNEKGQLLLNDYLKKTKSSGRILVMSLYGDLVFHAGKGGPIDATSAGSIFAAIQTATGGLNQVLGTKATTVRFGEDKKGFWLEPLANEWLVVGVKTPLKANFLSTFLKHLKSASKNSKRMNAAEALDGVCEAAVDAALAKDTE